MIIYCYFAIMYKIYTHVMLLKRHQDNKTFGISLTEYLHL